MPALELVTSGYRTVEGLTVDTDHSLYFTDINNGGVRRIDPQGAVELVVPKRKGVGGTALHADGGVVVAGRDISHIKDGRTRIIFGPEHYAANGLPPDVNSFN